MINKINIICLGVEDIDKSLKFYKALGFKTSFETGSPIVFFNNKGTKLELFPLEELAKDIDKDNPPKTTKSSFNGITLACNMGSKDEVDKVFNLVRSIGGVIVKNPKPTSWGGYSGYFKDLDGYHWEVAYGPMWEFDENEMLIIK